MVELVLISLIALFSLVGNDLKFTWRETTGSIKKKRCPHTGCKSLDTTQASKVKSPYLLGLLSVYLNINLFRVKQKLFTRTVQAILAPFFTVTHVISVLLLVLDSLPFFPASFLFGEYFSSPQYWNSCSTIFCVSSFILFIDHNYIV